LGNDTFAIQTVEHLLSAISAFDIDNILIQVEGNEILVGDGSSKIFAEMLEKAQIAEQNENRKEYILEKPVYFSENQTHIVALPCDEYKISYTLHHPTNLFLKSQYLSYVVDSESYKTEIAPSRTFSVYEEIKPLLDKNLIKGGDLDNAVVIKDNKIVNPEGVRFSNEMVRHKILDLMGDLCLMSKSFKAHIIAICTSHRYNVSFAKKFEKYLTLVTEENR
jgi:UDP-3-O-[3-hydroxymyristoyl] N-acetylglucosamine deacetylase